MTEKASKGRAIKVSVAQLREFVESTAKSPQRVLVEGPGEVRDDYRRRLKLGYEPLLKAKMLVEKDPELAHHAEKLAAILSDLATLFKETTASPKMVPTP